MARMYQTRNFLIQAPRSEIYDKNVDALNRWTDSMKAATRGYAKMGAGIANSLADLYNRYQREGQFENLESHEENMKDPMYRMAFNDYVQTGNTAAMTNWENAQTMAKNRAAEKEYQLQAQEAERQRRYNLELESARPQYLKLQQDYVNGNPEQKLLAAEGMRSLEAKFPELGQFKELDKVIQAKEQREYNEAVAAEDLKWAEEKAKKEEELFNKKSLDNRDFIINNFIPTKFKDEEEKAAVREIARHLFTAGGLSEKDYNTVISKIDAEQSQKKQNVEAAGTAQSSAVQKQTEQAITDQKNRDKAQGYIGKVISELEWDIMDSDVKSHIVRDGTGKVTGVK